MNDSSNESSKPIQIGKYATSDSSQSQNDPPQDFQPEQGLHDPDDRPRSRTQTGLEDAAGIAQDAKDDITEAPEEA